MGALFITFSIVVFSIYAHGHRQCLCNISQFINAERFVWCLGLEVGWGNTIYSLYRIKSLWKVPHNVLKKCVCVTRSLGLPVTDHTYEDCRLMIAAGELTLPMEAGLVEFTKISRKLEYGSIFLNTLLMYFGILKYKIIKMEALKSPQYGRH